MSTTRAKRRRQSDMAGERNESGASCSPYDASAAHRSVSVAEKATKRARVVRCFACGCINAVLVTPVLMSFATIIFSDAAFAPYLPRLVRLVLVSGLIHQAVFTIRSSLPFAVGSVQDAGLIFLSSIATAVAAGVKAQNGDDAAVLATACFTLCICTALLGAALVITGRLKLASLVQYLPMPVIGGYLAWLGFFCGSAGLSFMASVQLHSLADWRQLCNPSVFLRILPGVCAGVFSFLALRRCRSVATLPLCMLGIISAFYAILAVTGTSLEEAREKGWVAPASASAPLWEAWSYFQPGKVVWSVVPHVIPEWIAMFLVVAFSSSLDVAAVEMELGTPIDYNRELQTVGWSNVVSGLTGGYTGSYIFSQTIFNLRAGVDSRLAGVVTTLVQGMVVAMPVSIVSYLPRCFFGALLILIALDLMIEWLWAARRRMMPVEYFVCVLTFVAIHIMGVQLGMLAGVVAAVLAFTVSYARVPNVLTAKIKDSTVVRTFEERLIIKAHRHQVLVLSLQGYIFFGSAVKILEDVKRHIVVPSSTNNNLNQTTEQRERQTVNQRAAETSETNSDVLPPTQQRGGNAHAYAPMDQCNGSGGSGGDGVAGSGSGSGGRKQQRRSPFTSPAEGRSGSSNGGAAAAEKAEKARGLSSSGNGFPAAAAAADSSPLRRPLPTSSAGAAANNSSLSTSTSGIAKSPISPKPGSSGTGGSGSLVPPLPPPPQPRVSLLDMRSPVFNRRSGSPSPPVRLQQLQQQEVAFPVGNSPARNSVLANALGTPSPSVHLLGPDAAAGTPMRATSSLHFGPAGNYSTFDARDDDAEVNLTAGIHSPRNLPAGSRAAAEDSYVDPEIGWSDDKRTVHAYMSLWATSSFRGEPVASDSDDIEDSSTRWLVLDFSAVLSVDATAARVCFLMLKQLLRASGVTLVFAGLGPKIRAVLQAHAVVQPDEPHFSTLDGALEWCEEQLLASVRAAAPVNSMAHTNKRSNFGTTKAAAAAAAAGSIGKERDAAAAQAYSDDKVNGRNVLAGDSRVDKKGVIRRDRLQQQAPLSAVLSASAKAKQRVNSKSNGNDGGFGSSESAAELAGEATSSAAAAARRHVLFPGENVEDEIFEEEENQENAEERADSSERDDPFGRHPSYYDKARQLRQGSNSEARNSSIRSSRSRSSEEAENRESKEGDEDEDCVGGLHAILQDYLELEPHGPPTRVGQLLLAATDFFQEEDAPAGTMLFSERDASTKLYFIARGAVELRKPPPVCWPQDEFAASSSISVTAAVTAAECAPRLAKVSAGGSFGELGFFLKRPQPFRAVATEDCRFYTLDRRSIAKMQATNPELCILVQKAVLKSLCLSAAFAIEAQHFGA